jgi:hypothetical protein
MTKDNTPEARPDSFQEKLCNLLVEQFGFEHPPEICDHIEEVKATITDLIEGQEHLLIPVGTTNTALRCSCGREFFLAVEAQQHQNWHFNLVVQKHDQALYKKLLAEFGNKPEMYNTDAEREIILRLYRQFQEAAAKVFSQPKEEK